MRKKVIFVMLLLLLIFVAHAQRPTGPNPDDEPAPVDKTSPSGSDDEFTDEELIEAFGSTDPFGFGDAETTTTDDAKTTTTEDATSTKTDDKPQGSTYGKQPGAGTTRAANVLKAYKEYKGLAAYTTLIWPEYGEWVQQNRQKLNEQFCFATGIRNCLQSRICGAIIPVQASNVLAGPGPTGQFVSSASLVAERSLPLEVEGMTTQQLIELFGATSAVINGQRVDFNDPDFDPAQLGPIQLRLYHIQFGLTNNAEDQERLNWNVEFLIGQNIRRKWFAQDQPLEYGAHIECDGTPGCHIYKLSATTYTDACLVFDKGLPVGTTYGRGVEWFNPTPSYQPYLCVPFVEYNGGPTSIGQASGGTQPSAAPPTGAGGNI